MQITNRKTQFSTNSRGALGGTRIYLTHIGTGTVPIASIKDPKEAKAVADSLNGLLDQRLLVIPEEFMAISSSRKHNEN